MENDCVACVTILIVLSAERILNTNELIILNYNLFQISITYKVVKFRMHRKYSTFMLLNFISIVFCYFPSLCYKVTSSVKLSYLINLFKYEN